MQRAPLLLAVAEALFSVVCAGPGRNLSLCLDCRGPERRRGGLCPVSSLITTSPFDYNDYLIDRIIAMAEPFRTPWRTLSSKDFRLVVDGGK